MRPVQRSIIVVLMIGTNKGYQIWAAAMQPLLAEMMK